MLAQVPRAEARLVAIDNANVYVIAFTSAGDPNDETLWRVPKTGGAPRALVTNQARIGGVDTTGTVFWTTGSGDDAGVDGAVWKLDALGNPSLVASNRPAPGTLIVVDAHVYWAEHGVDAQGQLYGAAMWTGIDGGEVTMLQRTDGHQIPQTFDANPVTLFWTTADPTLGNEAAAQVVSAPLPLPYAPTTLITGADAGGAGAIELLDSGDLLYSGPTGITAYPPSPASSLFVPTSGFVAIIEESGPDFYFVDPASGELLSASTPAGDSGTSPVRTVATNMDPASAFQVDTSCVYWVDADAEAVMMVHR
jgi:hypothetical protein